MGPKKFGYPSHCAATSAKKEIRYFALAGSALKLSRVSLTAFLFLTFDPCRYHTDIALFDD